MWWATTRLGGGGGGGQLACRRATSEEDGGGAGMFRHGAHGRKHDATRIHESSSEHEGEGGGME